MEPEPILKFPTDCCALAQLSIQNYHSREDIQKVIDSQKKEANSRKWFGSGTNRLGQKNLFVVTTPAEKDLEKNLKELGFQCLANNLNRRTGYPPGKLKFWLLTLD